MVISFNNEYLEKIFKNQTVRGKPRYSAEVIVQFKKTVLKLQFLGSIRDLHNLKGLNFEALKGEYIGFHSVRVDKKYRLILRVQAEGTIEISEILVIEDLTNHYQ